MVMMIVMIMITVIMTILIIVILSDDINVRIFGHNRAGQVFLLHIISIENSAVELTID